MTSPPPPNRYMKFENEDDPEETERPRMISPNMRGAEAPRSPRHRRGAGSADRSLLESDDEEGIHRATAEEPPPMNGTNQQEDPDKHTVDLTAGEIGLDPESGFHRLKSIPMASVAIAANLVMIILVFLLPILCEGKQDNKKDVELCRLAPFSILVYSHAIHWVIHLITDQYLKKEHKRNRLNGYIEFYLQTKNIRRTPFYLVSVGNAVLLITVTALHDYCDPIGCEDSMMKVDYLRGLITLEALVIICLWFNYIINVREFHAKAPLPDVINQDVLLQLHVLRKPRKIYAEGFENGEDPEHPRERVLNRDQIEDFIRRFEGRELPTRLTRKDILERQAELIRYLRGHCVKLNRNIMELAQRVVDVENPVVLS